MVTLKSLIFVLLLAITLGAQLWGHALQNIGLIALTDLLVSWPDEINFQRAEDVESLLNRTLVLTPDSLSIEQNLADVLFVQGHIDGAVILWRQTPYGADVLLQRGLLAKADEHYKEAFTWFELATRTEPESVEVWSQKVFAHIELEQWDKAQETLRLAEKSIRTSDIASSAYFELGELWQLHMEPPDLTAALSLYELALAADSFAKDEEYIQANYHKGEILQQQGRFDEAIPPLKLVVTEQPEHYWANVRLGSALWLADPDNATEAEKHLAVAATIGPNQKWAYRWLGTIYQNTGRLDQAAQMYRRVLEIDPEDRIASKFFSD